MSTASKRKAALLRRYVPREQFEIEKNAKNTAYAFILTHGYFQQFVEFFHQQRAAAADNFVTAFETIMQTGGNFAKLNEPTEQAKKTMAAAQKKIAAQAQPVDASAASTDTDNTASASADEASEGENK